VEVVVASAAVAVVLVAVVAHLDMLHTVELAGLAGVLVPMVARDTLRLSQGATANPMQMPGSDSSQYLNGSGHSRPWGGKAVNETIVGCQCNNPLVTGSFSALHMQLGEQNLFLQVAAS